MLWRKQATSGHDGRRGRLGHRDKVPDVDSQQLLARRGWQRGPGVPGPPDEDGSVARVFQALGQLSLGVVSAGLVAMAVISVKEYLATNERELLALKTYVKKQYKVLGELEDFKQDLSGALESRAKARLPPPPNDKVGILMEPEVENEESIIDSYKQEKFRIQQTLESLQAKTKIYNQGCQQLAELVIRKKVPLAVLNMYVADAKSTCKELDETISFGEGHLMKLLKQIKTTREALSKDELGKLTPRDLETFIALHHNYLTDLEQDGAYAYLFAKPTESSGHPGISFELDDYPSYSDEDLFC
ncbi:unnamed protein product [Notodromas monacha]|uniref:Uncharacterized protein n=1 Tax=Notodromas monacha TaxID=399045 RepID=A0A7R9BW04_9CRUS|nr:unnamed protein product [Notodromas monacha]CAG0922768.1 unnamed protein product [Notodromas monacha]